MKEAGSTGGPGGCNQDKSAGRGRIQRQVADHQGGFQAVLPDSNSDTAVFLQTFYWKKRAEIRFALQPHPPSTCQSKHESPPSVTVCRAVVHV